MSQERVLNTLMGFALTRTDAQVYIFLAKKGPQRAIEVGKALKMGKPQLYRSLKSLEGTGIVSATLEHPAKFSALPFEKALDLLAKAKMKKALEEAQRIQENKDELLANWQSLAIGDYSDMSARFMVIEGRNNIYARIQQMIMETKNQISTMTTVPSLTRADQFGLFDGGFKHPLKSKIKFRFLTEMSEQNVPAMKALLKGITDAKLDFEGRNPDLGLRLFPRMVIRDEDEILFFIKSRIDMSATEQDDVCLWTNCRDLVKAFTAIFDDYWRNATDIQQKIIEIETGKPTPTAFIIDDAETAKKKYDMALQSTKEEIIMMTSLKGLLGSWKTLALLKEFAKKGVSVRIMAPIMSENLEAAQQLSECCEVRHVSMSHLETTIIDGKQLFQFSKPSPDLEKPDAISYFQNTFCTSDLAYVEKMKGMLIGIWNSASAPSTTTLDSILRPTASTVVTQESASAIAEKDAVNAQKDQAKLSAKSGFGGRVTIGRALIHPPSHLNLPDMMIQVYKSSKESDFGDSDTVVFALCLPTPTFTGYTFVPVAVVGNSPRPVIMWKALLAGTPAGQNIIVVKPEQLEVWKQGNTLFGGWTVPIPLLPRKHILPPSCILFEGIGLAKHQTQNVTYPSGYKSTVEFDGLEAFVTFINPSSKYAGPGTDGSLGMNVVATTIPP